MNNSKKFIFKNILALIIEYLCISLINYLIFKHSLTNMLIADGIIIILMIIILILSRPSIKKLGKETNIKNEVVEQIVSSVNKEYQLKLKTIYLDLKINNPAASFKDFIIINTKSFDNYDFPLGIVGHEIGHAVSGVSRGIILSTLRPSWIISRLLWSILSLQKNSVVFIIIYPLYIMINLINLLFIYPDMRKDEITADTICCKLGFGEELRCYYGKLYNKYLTDKKHFEYAMRIDYAHPHIKKSIDNFNHVLNIDKYSNLYYVKNTLYQVIYQDHNVTLKVPDFITIIKPGAIQNDHLRKLIIPNVTNIKSSMFDTPNLEELIIPSVQDFDRGLIKKMPLLKEIRINDFFLYDSLCQDYPNIKIKLLRKRNINMQPIGVFDSGVGGLTVLKELQKDFPNETFIYLADEANVPYGTKPEEEIIACVKRCCDALVKQNVKAIVIACNTASTFIDAVKDNYNIPLIGVIKPTASFAANTLGAKKALVLATNATINKGMYQKYLGLDGVNTTGVPVSEFVEYIENHLGDETLGNEVVQNKLQPYQNENYDVVIYGCTHFGIIEPLIKKYTHSKHYLGCGVPTSQELKKTLNDMNAVSTAKTLDQYFTSGAEGELENKTKWFASNISFKHLDL